MCGVLDQPLPLLHAAHLCGKGRPWEAMIGETGCLYVRPIISHSTPICFAII